MQVFLSHASEDVDTAREIAKLLESEGMAAWFQAEIFPGDDWGAETSKALEASDAMVVVLTPAAARSKGVGHEIEFALQSSRYAKRLITVVCEPTEDIPWILKKLQVIDFHSDPAQGKARLVEELRALTS